MPQITLQAGAKLFVPDHGDLKNAAQEAIEEDRELYRARGVKFMRLPQTLSGTPAASALTLGVSKGQTCGPEQGYAWVVKKLVITGLATGTPPDIMNFYLNDRFSGPVWWQLNGNSFGETFGNMHQVLLSGDTLALQNVGTLAATGLIQVSGDVIEVPGEMLWKLT